MRKHQRYFPVVDVMNGQLLPAFIAVRIGDVVHNHSAVIKPSFHDQCII
jgi:glycyl-tRNA synthetase beta subunit